MHQNTPTKGASIAPLKTQALLKSCEIKKLQHNELVEYATNVTQDLRSLNQRLFDPQSGAITKLRNELSAARSVNDFLLKKISDLGRQCISNSQDSRKETIEISGIPETIPDTGVESKVCALLNAIKVETSPAYTS